MTPSVSDICPICGLPRCEGQPNCVCGFPFDDTNSGTGSVPSGQKPVGAADPFVQYPRPGGYSPPGWVPRDTGKEPLALAGFVISLVSLMSLVACCFMWYVAIPLALAAFVLSLLGSQSERGEVARAGKWISIAVVLLTVSGLIGFPYVVSKFDDPSQSGALKSVGKGH